MVNIRASYQHATGVSRDGYLTARCKIGRHRGEVCRRGGTDGGRAPWRGCRGVFLPSCAVDYFDDSGSRLQPALREAAVCAFPRSRWGGDAVEHDFSVNSVTNDDREPPARPAVGVFAESREEPQPQSLWRATISSSSPVWREKTSGRVESGVARTKITSRFYT